MDLQRSIKAKVGRGIQVRIQFLLSILVVTSMVLIGFSISPSIGYQGVALLMLMAVSFLAIVLDILPVLLAAVLSALAWNYFFIPPRFTFGIQNTEDLFLFLMYFFIAMVNAVLTYKIKDRNKKISDREEKEKTIKLYNTILNSLSHELRTPISTIIGAVDVMKEQNGRLSTINKEELLNEIGKASLRLNQQVENLLGLSRLESGMVKLKLDWMDINELVHRVIHKFTDPNPHQSIIFLPGDNLPLFKLDAVLIDQVIFNLIQNAILYTPNRAEISISTEYLEEKCRITVRDNGPGFPISALPTAFDKFYQVSPTNSTGTGLGLAIVKGFVEAHNGTIQLSNNITGGASFIIELPAETSFIQNLKNE